MRTVRASPGTASSPRARRRSSRGSAAGSSAPSSAPPTSSPCGPGGTRPMRLDDHRLLGLLPRPRLRGELLPGGGRRTSGRTWRILLDLGSGALGALQRFADPLGIDAVFISHLHADHCLDLCGYYVLRQVPPRTAPSRGSRSGARWAPRPDGPRLRPAARPRDERASSRSTSYGGPVQLGPFVVEPVPGRSTRSRPSACASPADGRTLAYSADTGPCAGLDQVADGADLLLARGGLPVR